jgi:hypothetical protein
MSAIVTRKTEERLVARISTSQVVKGSLVRKDQYLTKSEATSGTSYGLTDDVHAVSVVAFPTPGHMRLAFAKWWELGNPWNPSTALHSDTLKLVKVTKAIETTVTIEDAA